MEDSPIASPATVFATLPMYDWPEVRPAWDELWGLARQSIAIDGLLVEAGLRRDEDPALLWRDPAMLVGQTCGWPYVTGLRGTVIPFARFDFGLGGQPGDYHSLFIAPEMADPAGLLADNRCVLAVNSFDSQSGFRAYSSLAGKPVPIGRRRWLATGSHRASIRAVAEGRAGLAAIDAMSWRLALHSEPAAQQVVVIGRSRDVPGLPLVTASRFAERIGLLTGALTSAVDGLSAHSREAVGICGLVDARDADYSVLEKDPFGRVELRD